MWQFHWFFLWAFRETSDELYMSGSVNHRSRSFSVPVFGCWRCINHAESPSSAFCFWNAYSLHVHTHIVIRRILVFVLRFQFRLSYRSLLSYLNGSSSLCIRRTHTHKQFQITLSLPQYYSDENFRKKVSAIFLRERHRPRKINEVLTEIRIWGMQRRRFGAVFFLLLLDGNDRVFASLPQVKLVNFTFTDRSLDEYFDMRWYYGWYFENEIT